MAVRKIQTASGLRFVAYFKYQSRQITKRFTRRADAVAWEAAEKKALRQPVEQACVLMFSQMSDAYLRDCEARMQPNSVRERLCHLKEFAAALGADMAAREITAAHAKSFIAAMQVKCGNKGANRRLRTLKATWNWHREFLPENPWRSVTAYPEDEHNKYVPPPDDMETILQLAQPWERRILLFLLATGARIGELFNLMWEDVNLERSTVQLRTRKRKGGSRQARLLPLSPTLYTILSELKQERPEGGAGHVFINPHTGGPYRKLQSSVRHMLKRLCRAAEVKEFGFHALRHFVAARLLDSQKANIVEIQQLLGHQRTTTTDTYLKSLSSAIGHLAAIIEEVVLPKSK